MWVFIVYSSEFIVTIFEASTLIFFDLVLRMLKLIAFQPILTTNIVHEQLLFCPFINLLLENVLMGQTNNEN